MKKIMPSLFLVMILLLTACTPAVTPTRTQTPTVEATPVDRKTYASGTFGLRFQYPVNWFGPGEYVSEQTLRVEVGSDIVYPYGEVPEQPSDVRNSYHVVIQYTKNNQNPAWKDTYQSLTNLQDGEFAHRRKKPDHKGQAGRALGRFKGFEFIFTLPEAAQTEHVYGREVLLVDGQTNDLLTIMGQPNNVEVGSGTDWRDGLSIH